MEVEKPGEEAPGNVSQASQRQGESVAAEEQVEQSQHQSRNGKQRTNER